MGRKDGKRIKKLSGMGQLIMDINPQRIGSEVYINQKIDVTELMKYLKAKKNLIILLIIDIYIKEMK